jgi:hypothetical protein
MHDCMRCRWRHGGESRSLKVPDALPIISFPKVSLLVAIFLAYASRDLRSPFLTR